MKDVKEMYIEKPPKSISLKDKDLSPNNKLVFTAWF